MDGRKEDEPFKTLEQLLPLMINAFYSNKKIL
jgi:HSP90 family molecular chaperone